MIIDAHAHMYHGSYLVWLSEAGGPDARKRIDRLEEAARRRPSTMDVAERLAMLDRNAFDFQVVTPPGGGNLPADENADRSAMVRIINDGMARLMEESKGRLIAGGTVSLTDFGRGGEEEMVRAVEELGLKAITVPSHFKGQPLDVPELEPFWARAEELDVPIYIHPSSPDQHRDRGYEAGYDLSHNFGWPFETELSLSRLVFSGIMERYPDLKVVGHHLGGGLPFFWGRTCETYAEDNDFNAANKASMSVLSHPLFEYFSRFYYDTAVGGSAAAIRCALEVFGPDHLLFATDAPNGPGTGEVRLATYPTVVRSLGLSAGDTENILSGNVRKMLKLG